MSFRDLQIKNEYRSLIDNIVQDFYIPLLHDAVSYRRAVGFFSSSSLVEISKGITHLVGNGGKIQIVASPYLSEEDVEAINYGICSGVKGIFTAHAGNINELILNKNLAKLYEQRIFKKLIFLEKKGRIKNIYTLVDNMYKCDDEI